MLKKIHEQQEDKKYNTQLSYNVVKYCLLQRKRGGLSNHFLHLSTHDFAQTTLKINLVYSLEI